MFSYDSGGVNDATHVVTNNFDTFGQFWHYRYTVLTGEARDCRADHTINRFGPVANGGRLFCAVGLGRWTHQAFDKVFNVGVAGAHVRPAAHACVTAVAGGSRGVDIKVHAVTATNFGDQCEFLGDLHDTFKTRGSVVGCALHKAVQDVTVLGSCAREHAPTRAKALTRHQVVEFFAPFCTKFTRFFAARNPIGNAAEHSEHVFVGIEHVLAFCH